MRNTKWIYKSEHFIPNNLEIDSDVEQILSNRNINTEEEIEIFLNGTDRKSVV